MNARITVFKPQPGPRTAFADGSWKNPKAEGPLGKIGWDTMSAKSIMVRSGVSRSGIKGYAVIPAITSTTIPAETVEILAERFANPIISGRRGLLYTRLGHVPAIALEGGLAGLHGCGDAMVFGSGMAAISHTVLQLVSSGDNVVLHRSLYGCTDSLFRKQLPELGIETRFVDLREPCILKQAIDSRTRAVFFETPSNPVLDLIDIKVVAKEVDNRCPVIVDNTFASPVGQNPFDQGAHIVIYSLTKSVSGHAKAIGGAALGSGKFLAHLFSIRKDIGGVLSPIEATTILDGMKTLSERYEKMEKNARHIAKMLCSHPEIEKVFYPEFDKRYDLDAQMKGPGYMITFILKKGLEGGKTLINNLTLIVNAVSLGSVETLMCHPASTTHSVVPPEERIQSGIVDGLVRLSVGIEAIEDIEKDLEQALDKVAKL